MFAVAPGCGDSETAAGGGAGEGGSPTLRFTAIPDRDETALRQKYEPVAAWLAEQLDVPVEYVHCTGYSDSVELFKNGDVQLAWFGGLTGVQARHAVPGARAIAQGESDPEFYSYFIAHKDAGVEPGDEFPHGLAGKAFTFGSDQSTSGRLMPEFFIGEATGKSPEEFFGHPNRYSGSHDATCEWVASGKVMAGALNYTVYDARVADGRTDPEVCRVIWKTPVYPDYNFTAHPALEEMFGAGFTDRLQQALIDLDDEQLLAAFLREDLIAATNEDFDAIEKLARDLGFLR